ncbi:MAG: ABC transporter ATP-binding protein [Candidatus Aenigmatarchaeota archaeon]
MLKKIKGFFEGDDNPLRSENVKFSYTDEEVLKDINLVTKKNKIYSIIGKSGSGKSTFLKLIAGVISKKHQGKIRIFGKRRTFRKNTFGFVSQEPGFIPDLSIENNIKISGLNYGISEDTALQRAEGLMEQLKLDVDLEKKPLSLSGGQKTRLGIILSILHDPKLIILDEPFVGLDFKNRWLLWRFLENKKKKGKSIILTSHLLTEIQEHADKIIILRDGKVFFRGKLDKLKNKLNMNYIYEVRFSWLAQSKWQKLKEYCNRAKGVDIIEKYEKHCVFSIGSEEAKKRLDKKFEEIGLKDNIINFREPNLDEIFLKT